jgi:hypothetical protein
MASIVVDGYIVIAVVNRSYGSIRYEVKNPDGSVLFTAGSSAGVSGGLSNLVTKANDAGNTNLSNQLSNLQSALVADLPGLDQQTIQEDAQPPPPATAATAASEDGPQGPTKPAQQTVRDNGRIVNTPDTTTPTNAIAPATLENAQGSTTGTDDPVRTTVQTQATGTGYNGNGYAVGLNVRAEDGTLSNLRKNPETSELYDPGGIPGGVDLTTNPGTPTNEDNVKPSATTAQTEVNKAQSTFKITPRDNPLDQYSSYSYTISVYLMSSGQYEQLLRSKTKKIDGYFLLFQSGGAGLNVGGSKDGMGTTTNISGADSGRNPFFPNDYYIDSLILDTLPLGKATGASHMTATMKITVCEPNGITLIDNLYSAVANLQQKTPGGKVNYTAADYLAVIRFYGYDADGNPTQIRAGDVTGTTNSKAIVEKFIPFKLGGINWGVSNKMVTYEWDCVPQGHLIGGYTARGAVPHDVQLSSTSIGKLLGNDVQYATAQSKATTPGNTTTQARENAIRAADEDRDIPGGAVAPPNAAAAASARKTVTQGLMGALTEFQDALTKTGPGQVEPIFTTADRYFIKFVDGADIPASAIENAKISINTGKVDLTQTPAAQPLAGPSGNPANLDPMKQAVDNASRNFSITAGQMITQVIDTAIRNSTYILDQALVKENADGYQIPDPNKRNSPMTWFNIIMNAVPRGDLDPKRNDYAYDITYTIKPFRLQNFDSKYFPVSRFAGVHKSYPYWFTGRNTAVLDYQETLNGLYSITVSGSDPKNSWNAKIRESATSSMRDIAKYQYAVVSGQSTQGSSDTRLNEPAANAADYLFSPGDLANCKVKIIGDPDWIQQGSLFREIKVGETEIGDSTGFHDDGSIAFDSGQVMFEIAWQRPEDYNIDTGLADPYGGGYSGNTNASRQPIQSRIYSAVKVVSEFRQGRFEQTLEGTLYLFPVPGKRNTVKASSSVTSVASPASSSQDRDGFDESGISDALATRTNATAARTNTNLTGRIQNNATTDPRSTQYSAAILGAQQVSSGATGALPSGNQRESTDARTVWALKNAAPPGAPTDGAGNTINAVPETVQAGPPKLNSVVARINAAAAAAGPVGRGSQPQKIAGDGG